MSDTVTRAVTVPVAGPADSGSPREAGDAWRDLRDVLYRAWDASTCLANWAVTQLLGRDTPRTRDMVRLPPMPRTYLYGLMGESYPGRGDWSGAAASANSVLRWVEKNYRARRRDVLWAWSASAQSFRWPVPYPVHNQTWSLAADGHGNYVASLPLPGGRVRLRLRNDRTMHYQRRRLALIAAGAVKRCEAAIYAKCVQGNDGRNGLLIRGPGGRQRYRVMLKLVAHFPARGPGDERVGDLVVHTGNESLLYAEQDGHDAWSFHGDDLRRRVFGHLARLQRSRDDLKHERRWPAEVRRRHREAEELACAKHGRFAATYIDQVTAMVAGLAERRRAARVVYDDSERGFLPQFRYEEMRSKLERKVRDRGIEFVEAASGPVVNETPAAARVQEGDVG